MWKWILECTMVDDDLEEHIKTIERTDWNKTLETFVNMVKHPDCSVIKVTCYLGDVPYPTNDPVVLEFRA